jgi:dienelactone hydrolase
MGSLCGQFRAAGSLAAPLALAGLLLFAGLTRAQAPAGSKVMELPRGQVIPRVACLANPEQSYALYLPSYFTPARSWPVIFIFEPAARGALPVELAKEAAEKYGYIVAGSNNSRNGPFRPQFDAAAAVTADLNERFPVDARRVYLAGFSGGARAAVSVALVCGDCAAGVILHGAGFPDGRPPTPDVQFPVFSLVGITDFNYSEMIALQDALKGAGIAHRLRRFAGKHDWAPSRYWVEAVEWLELLAMKQDRRARDAAWVETQLAARAAHARELEAAGEAYPAWEEYRDMARDFAGLAAVASLQEKARAMAQYKAVRQGQRAEQREREEQEKLLHRFNLAFHNLLELPELRAESIPLLASEIDHLVRRRQKGESDWRGRVAERCHAQVTARLYEAGEDRMSKKEFSLAGVLFTLMIRAAGEQPGPYFHLARASAQAGKEKEALRALATAIERGMTRAELLDREEFQSLRGNPQFERLREDLRARRASPPAR